MAKLADAPDLGFRNRRFQSVAFRFKKSPVLRGENAISDLNVLRTTILGDYRGPVARRGLVLRHRRAFYQKISGLNFMRPVLTPACHS